MHQLALALHGLLGVLFVVTVVVIIERVVVFARHKNDVYADAAALEGFLQRRDIAAAIEFFEGQSSIASQMLVVALRQFPHGPNAVEKGANGASLLLRERMERGLTLLATIGNNAPFVGLLGTVLGIVGAFAHLGANADNSTLMTAISEALIATAVGLVVALPAVAAYNHLQRKVDSLLNESEALWSLAVGYAEDYHGKPVEARNGRNAA